MTDFEFDDQLWIGVPDERKEKTTSDALYSCRIGGLPVWMYDKPTANAVVACPTCKSHSDLSLISQLFAPLFDLDRILYIFLCRKCAKIHSKTHPEKAIVAVRCQNVGPDFDKNNNKADDKNNKQEDEKEEKQKEETTNKTEQQSSAATEEDATKKQDAFAVEDDWGDDDDGSANNNKFVPPPNLAAEEAEKKRKEAEQEKIKKEQEEKEKMIAAAKSNKFKPQEVKTSIGGLNKCRCFNEYTLDIYDYEDDDDSDNDDDDDDDSDNNNKVSSAELNKQLDEIKKKYPNAEIDLESNPIVTHNHDDEDIVLENDGDDDDTKKSNNKAKQQQQQQQQSKNELHLKQFDLFVKTITKQDSSQVIRWQPSGFPLLAAPLSISQQQQQQQQRIHGVPKCDKCGCQRMFEVQIVSPAIYFLSHSNSNIKSGAAAASSKNNNSNKTSAEDEEMLNFATIMVFTCSNPYCDIENKYVRDHVIVQQEPLLEEAQAQQQKAAVQSGKR